MPRPTVHVATPDRDSVLQRRPVEEKVEKKKEDLSRIEELYSGVEMV
jgi:hypothetical protein